MITVLLCDTGNRFALRNNPKKTIKQAVQNKISVTILRFNEELIFNKMSGVIGSFRFTTSPLSRFTPRNRESRVQFCVMGFGSPISLCTRRMMDKYFGIDETWQSVVKMHNVSTQCVDLSWERPVTHTATEAQVSAQIG